MAGMPLPVLCTLCAVWMTVSAISVETPREALKAARGKSVTLPCRYHTSASNRDGVIQWDKLLVTHTESVCSWKFSTQSYTCGDLYTNRVKFSDKAEESDASITIDQLTMADNGTYECRITLMTDLEGTSNSRVRLLVLVPPSKPDCGIEGETVIGNNIQLTCQSKEGSPAPQYSWKSYDILNKERAGGPGMGQTLSLKNISTDMSGFYICTSSNEVGTETCNITVTVRPPSMNVALYAGIAGGVLAALILIGILVYCCCCREKSEAEDTRPNRAIYREPPQQVREHSEGEPLRELPGGELPREFSGRRDEEDSSRHGDLENNGSQSPDYAGRR